LEKGNSLRRLPVAVLTGLVIATLLPAAPAAANAQRDAIDQLNKIRQAHGLKELRPSLSLHRSSTRYARHMVDSGYFGHASRIAVSSRFSRVGETLELHSGWAPEPGLAMKGWMNSPTHRDLLLSPTFKWVGMGIARGTNSKGQYTVWVAHLGRMR
jgi:uncharacterized protein YkwD